MSKQNQAVLPPLEGAGYHRDTFLMMLPLLAMAVYLYGWRPALLSLVAVVTANLCDRFVALLRRRAYDRRDMSSEGFAFVLVMLLPASVDYYIVIVAVIAAVLMGKEAFGGYGCYPFHPTAVGFVVVAISWPEQVFRYPQPFAPLPLSGAVEVPLVNSMTSTMKSGGLPAVNTLDLLLGNYPGAMGATAALIILSCALYLVVQRRISLRVPLCFLAACSLVVVFFPRLGGVPISWPWEYFMDRLVALKFELLSGGTLFAAVFLVAEPVTMPKNKWSQMIYAALAGVMSVMFRYYGSFETGVCFALLMLNALAGWLDRATLGLISKKEVRRHES